MNKYVLVVAVVVVVPLFYYYFLKMNSIEIFLIIINIYLFIF